MDRYGYENSESGTYLNMQNHALKKYFKKANIEHTKFLKCC